MKRIIGLLAMTMVVAFMTLGCGDGGGDSSPPPAPPAVDVTGTWSGPYNSSVFGSRSMTMNLQQIGGSVTGTYSSSTGALGTVSGSVSDNTMSGTITVTTPGCSGSFNGTGIVNIPPISRQQMSFSYNGSSTCGGAESGTGFLAKQ
jgi:hypothetical protein